eukprot:GHRR01008989.1.p1 GENE.GHRR01008989.1~~GHRR01008989.1.p1  ORF type:complete len:136 (-),score=16.82 GHRR01008989.1:749-1156(-)
MVAPICAGDLLIVTPAASSAAILSVALPLPPLMIAPACPMRRPGGAVRPAMNDTTGFCVPDALMKSAASSSAIPPISPIMIMPSVCGSLTNFSKQSTKFVPLKGSPPMPTTVDCPRPSLVVWKTACMTTKRWPLC